MLTILLLETDAYNPNAVIYFIKEKRKGTHILCGQLIIVNSIKGGA